MQIEAGLIGTATGRHLPGESLIGLGKADSMSGGGTENCSNFLFAQLLY